MTYPAQPPATPPGAPVPPRSPRPDPGRLLVGAGIAVIAVLLLAMGALVALRGTGQPGPAASPPAAAVATTPGLPTSGATATPASPSGAAPTASPSTGVSLEAQIAAIEREVVPIRQLDPTGPVPDRIIDTAELADLVRADFDASNPPATLHAAEALLERLRLLPAGTDLRALTLEARSSQVLGFYDFRTKQMTIVRRSGGFGPLEEVTLAHEYTHALQDQHFGIAGLGLSSLDQSDRVLARTALVEGDASLAMTQWMLRDLTPAELAQVSAASADPVAQSVLARMPALLRQEMLFPYLDGTIFLSRLFGSGGWQAVNDVYARPPDSTEQILHPDKYLAREEPIPVSLPPIASRLGTGWRLSASDTAGEFVTQVWLGAAMPSTAAAAAAAGWGGDRIGSFDGPDGHWALAWLTAWDDPAAAARFAPAALTATGAFAQSRVIDQAASSRVTILVASDATTLDALAAAVAQP